MGRPRPLHLLVLRPRLSLSILRVLSLSLVETVEGAREAREGDEQAEGGQQGQEEESVNRTFSFLPKCEIKDSFTRSLSKEDKSLTLIFHPKCRKMRSPIFKERKKVQDLRK